MGKMGSREWEEELQRETLVRMESSVMYRTDGAQGYVGKRRYSWKSRTREGPRLRSTDFILT